MHLIHVHAGNFFGGIERVLLTMAQHAPQTIRQTFVLYSEGILSSELDEIAKTRPIGIKLFAMFRYRNPSRVMKAAVQFRFFRRSITGKSLIVAHGLWSYVFLRMFCLIGRKSVVLYAHDIYHGVGWLDSAARLFPPHQIWANSQITAKSFAQAFPRAQIEVIYAPIPAAQLVRPRALIRADFGLKQNHVLILLASRFELGKGHLQLIDALSSLVHYAHWRCVVAGAPGTEAGRNLRATLLRRIANLGLKNRIQFIGHRGDIGDLMNSCDIYCQPNSSPDALGLSILEAMLLEKPVITSAIGAPLEYLHKGNGRLIPAEDTSALSRALEELITKPEIRVQLGQAAAESARMLTDTNTFFHKILSSKFGI